MKLTPLILGGQVTSKKKLIKTEKQPFEPPKPLNIRQIERSCPRVVLASPEAVHHPPEYWFQLKSTSNTDKLKVRKSTFRLTDLMAQK